MYGVNMPTSVELAALLVVFCCLNSINIVPFVAAQQNIEDDPTIYQRLVGDLMSEPHSEAHLNRQLRPMLQTHDYENHFAQNVHVRESNKPAIPMFPHTVDDTRIPPRLIEEMLRRRHLEERQIDDEHPAIPETADNDYESKRPITEYDVGAKTTPKFIRNLAPINLILNLCKGTSTHRHSSSRMHQLNINIDQPEPELALQDHLDEQIAMNPDIDRRPVASENEEHLHNDTMQVTSNIPPVYRTNEFKKPEQCIPYKGPINFITRKMPIIIKRIWRSGPRCSIVSTKKPGTVQQELVKPVTRFSGVRPRGRGDHRILVSQKYFRRSANPAVAEEEAAIRGGADDRGKFVGEEVANAERIAAVVDRTTPVENLTVGDVEVPNERSDDEEPPESAQADAGDEVEKADSAAEAEENAAAVDEIKELAVDEEENSDEEDEDELDSNRNKSFLSRLVKKLPHRILLGYAKKIMKKMHKRFDRNGRRSKKRRRRRRRSSGRRSRAWHRRPRPGRYSSRYG